MGWHVASGSGHLGAVWRWHYARRVVSAALSKRSEVLVMRGLVALCLGVATLIGSVAPTLASEAVLARLAEPGVHAVMRHALAPGTNDPADFDLRDCATQRNLNEDGRRQARRAGEILRAAGVVIDHLWSSQFCRCLETAALMEVGEVEGKSFLNSFIRTPHRRPERVRQITEALAALPEGETAFLVAHNVTGEALTGDRPISGEIQVVRLGPDGRYELLGSVEVPVF